MHMYIFETFFVFISIYLPFLISLLLPVELSFYILSFSFTLKNI